MPWGLTPAHLIIVLVIVLIVVGPGKLPDTGAAIGKALRGFKDAVDGNEPSASATQQQVAPPVQPQATIYQPPMPAQPYPPQQPYAPAQPYPPQQPYVPQQPYAPAQPYPPQQPYVQAPYQPPMPTQPYMPPAGQPMPLAPTDQPGAPQGEPPHQG
jgi:Sec-independent protein secretion pathway components